jgi:outer membrane protein OmpA-like peptidoglycan-associated protein
MPNLGNFVVLSLPNGTALHVPQNGVEGRLLAFIRDPNRAPDSTSWFDFDRLLFDSGSATLQPQSNEQLQNIASILRAYPTVHMRIGGYSDNVGVADRNLRMSNDRARSVMDALVNLGIAPDRLDARGFGDANLWTTTRLRKAGQEIAASRCSSRKSELTWRGSASSSSVAA